MKTSKILSIAFTVIFSLATTSMVSAATLATWGSTVSDGNLEGSVGIYTASVLDSIQGAGLSGATDGGGNDITAASSPAILGGEIIYSTAADGAVDATTDLSGAITDNQYFQFTFTVTGLGAGETLDIDTFDYSKRINLSSMLIRHGWTNSQLTWRVNDTAFATGDAAGSIHSTDTSDPIAVQDFSINAGLPTGLGNGDVVNFRLYAWGTDNDGTTNGANDFHGATRLGAVEIDGSVLIPEPGTLLLLGVALIALVLERRSFRGR